MKKNVEIIQINISGSDKPGLTVALTKILAHYNAFILDIGQANIHQSLALGILFKTTSDKAGDIMKDLLFKANELDINIKFTLISEEEYTAWVENHGKNRNIVTLLGRNISASQISAVSDIIVKQNLNIDEIRRLTGRIQLDEKLRGSKVCIELSVRGTPKDKQLMQQNLLELSSEMNFDISMQHDDMFRRTRRLICFDMDSTLIETEVIDELAKRAGVGKEVAAITESAMRGEIDFQESFIRRVSMLKDLDVSVMQNIAENLPISEGLESLMSTLKYVGFKTAILSGGFTFFAKYLQQKFGFDYVYANELEIKNNKLTGKHLGDIVDGKRKSELLKMMAQVEKIDIAQVVAVGDGANDLPMLSTAGLGIAFHAKPKVKANAEQAISTIGLDGILYLLGLKDLKE